MTWKERLTDTLRLACVLGAVAVAAYGGYGYGHQEGMQDSDTATMRLFFERCFVADTPAFCQEMIDAFRGYANETGEP